MPGFIHESLARVKCRLTVLKAEQHSLEATAVECQNALAQNATDQAHCVQRIAELEAEINGWTQNTAKRAQC